MEASRGLGGICLTGFGFKGKAWGLEVLSNQRASAEVCFFQCVFFQGFTSGLTVFGVLQRFVGLCRA